MGAFAWAASRVAPLDQDAAAAALELHIRLTKPRGALGRLEAVGVQLAAIAGTVPPPLPTPAAVAVFAGDHGVWDERVSPWPKEVTAQMVANFVEGGAAISVLARQAGARLSVVDIGVEADLPAAPGLLHRKVRPGTRNLAREAALTAAEVATALDAGAEVAALLVDEGAACLVTGDMGIANTTPSAAVIAAVTGAAPADVGGRGTGVDDAGLARKVAAISAGLARVPAGADGRRVLAEVGGLEVAALAGFCVAGVAARVPVVVDGVVALAALCAAERLVPGTAAGCIAAHRSPEPAASVALAHLGLEPLLDLGLRLGEGTGACLALGLVEAGARILREMATFDGAGVSAKEG